MGLPERRWKSPNSHQNQFIVSNCETLLQFRDLETDMMKAWLQGAVGAALLLLCGCQRTSFTEGDLGSTVTLDQGSDFTVSSSWNNRVIGRLLPMMP
jgi:hypothetical protein